MKKFNIQFSYSCDGDIEICANSEEEAIHKFRCMSFGEITDMSDAWCDATEMDIDDVYEVEDND